MLRQIIEFNRMIGNLDKAQPTLPTEAEAKWLHAALNEEADEFLEACELDKDLPAAVDGLIDSIYFAVGGLYRLGLTETQITKCFDAVHSANMEKRRGKVGHRPNDGTINDAVKPEGWKDPVERIREILNAR